ncbi:MAG TPA: hypothetical protein DCE18_07195, partial [Syntrophobacteraceae bacterium]|nr:hypothetical protein [Syntrophobacteraceae bacterium]
MVHIVRVKHLQIVRLTMTVVTLCLMPLGADGRAGAQAMAETPSGRQASSFLPVSLLTSSQHRVQEPVDCDGYMHRYTVDSAFGV